MDLDRETLKQKRDLILREADCGYAFLLSYASRRAERDVEKLLDLLWSHNESLRVFSGIRMPIRFPLLDPSSPCREACLRTYIARLETMLGQRFQFRVDSSDAPRGKDEEGMFEEYQLIVSICLP